MQAKWEEGEATARLQRCTQEQGEQSSCLSVWGEQGCAMVCRSAQDTPHVAPLHPALLYLPSTLAQGTCPLETGKPCRTKNKLQHDLSLHSDTDGYDYYTYHSVGVSPSLCSMRCTTVGGDLTGETPKSKSTAALVLTGTRRRMLHKHGREEAALHTQHTTHSRE